jgi:hypothetical protein
MSVASQPWLIKTKGGERVKANRAANSGSGCAFCEKPVFMQAAGM